MFIDAPVGPKPPSARRAMFIDVRWGQGVKCDVCDQMW